MINEFYRKGYVEGDLDKMISKKLRDFCLQDNYVKDGDGRRSPDVAAWENGSPTDNLNVPSVLRDIFSEIAETMPFLEFFRSRYGPFSNINIMLQRYRVGHGMDWHSDVYDPCPIVILCYFKDYNYSSSDGGKLQIGEADITERYLPAGDVSVHGEVAPIDGRYVVLLNNNPRFLHRVTKFEGSGYRYSLVVQFGYTENAFSSYLKHEIGDW